MLTIRPATLDDAKLLFEWRNDEETRRQSVAIDPVSWDGHMAWLKGSLNNPHRILAIAENSNVPIGTVRADFRDDGFAEISYTVTPSARGMGYSKPMAIQFVHEFLSGKKIAAHIKKGHKPSESVAGALGLFPHHETPSENPNDPRPVVEWR